MGQFKRARLSGSDELFRSTRPGDAKAGESGEAGEPGESGEAGELGKAGSEREGAVDSPLTEPVADTLSVELTVPEIRSVVEALQLARFPERQRSRPTMGEFESLGELQDRLRRLLAE